MGSRRAVPSSHQSSSCSWICKAKCGGERGGACLGGGAACEPHRVLVCPSALLHSCAEEGLVASQHLVLLGLCSHEPSWSDTCNRRGSLHHALCGRTNHWSKKARQKKRGLATPCVEGTWRLPASRAPAGGRHHPAVVQCVGGRARARLTTAMDHEDATQHQHPQKPRGILKPPSRSDKKEGFEG